MEMSMTSPYLSRNYQLLTCPISCDILSRSNRQLPLLFRLAFRKRRQAWWTIFVWWCLNHSNDSQGRRRMFEQGLKVEIAST
jgi:hypothetical protein